MQAKKTIGVLALAQRMAAVAGIVAVGSLSVVQPVLGAAAGTFTMLIVSTYSYTTVEHSDVTTFGGGSNGVGIVVESSGAPFTKGSHSDATCVIYGTKISMRFRVETACTFNDAGGKNSSTYRAKGRGVARRRAGAAVSGCSKEVPAGFRTSVETVTTRQSTAATIRFSRPWTAPGGNPKVCASPPVARESALSASEDGQVWLRTRRNAGDSSAEAAVAPHAPCRQTVLTKTRNCECRKPPKMALDQTFPSSRQHGLECVGRRN